MLWHGVWQVHLSNRQAPLSVDLQLSNTCGLCLEMSENDKQYRTFPSMFLWDANVSMVWVAAPLSQDSCILLCGLYSWLSFKGNCTVKHVAATSLTLWIMKRGIPKWHPADAHGLVYRQVPGSTGALAALPVQGRVVLYGQGSSLSFGCSVGFSLGFFVLCFHVVAIAVQPFTMDM